MNHEETIEHQQALVLLAELEEQLKSENQVCTEHGWVPGKDWDRAKKHYAECLQPSTNKPFFCFMQDGEWFATISNDAIKRAYWEGLAIRFRSILTNLNNIQKDLASFTKWPENNPLYQQIDGVRLYVIKALGVIEIAIEMSSV